MIRTLMYYIHTHSILRKNEEKYKQKIEILRTVAAFMNIYKSFTYSALVDIIKEIDPKFERIIEEEKKEIENSILIADFLIYNPQKNTVEFIHRNFKNYFLAEYYYVNIIRGKKYALYAGMPNKDVIDFLKDFVKISRNSEILKVLRKLCGDNLKNEIMSFFNYNKLRINSISFLESNDVVSPIIRIKENKKFKAVQIVNPIDEWLYRWICLCVLTPEDLKVVKKLGELIKYASQGIPYYLKKFKGANLRGADLRGADLSRADLSEANLRGADLRGADLRWANLWEANLRRTDLEGANLEGTNLKDLTYLKIQKNNKT